MESHTRLETEIAKQTIQTSLFLTKHNLFKAYKIGTLGLSQTLSYIYRIQTHSIKKHSVESQIAYLFCLLTVPYTEISYCPLCF